MLIKPNIKLNRITDISVELLQKLNIKGLMLDVDNTLSIHHGQVLTEGLAEWLEEMRSAGISLIVLSNSNKKRVAPFAEKIGLPYIPCALKPLPFGYFRAARKMKLMRKEMAIVGDQLFTDSLGGNLAGVTTIILNPIQPEDMLGFRVKRKLEDFLYKHYKFKEVV